MATDSVARSMALSALASGGGSEPENYIKNASVNGSTLTLTKKDNSTVTFTDTNTVYTAGDNITITNNSISATVPTKTSDLTNDSGYITNSYHDSTKQDTLTAGLNVTINNNVISATDTTYTAGDNIIIEDEEISCKKEVEQSITSTESITFRSWSSSETINNPTLVGWTYEDGFIEGETYHVKITGDYSCDKDVVADSDGRLNVGTQTRLIHYIDTYAEWEEITLHKGSGYSVSGSKTIDSVKITRNIYADPLFEIPSTVNANVITTDVDSDDSYVLTKRIRAEGDADTYYHSIDINDGNAIKFYEYGGEFVFYKNDEEGTTHAEELLKITDSDITYKGTSLQGGGAPESYIKNASVSNKTLTLTKQDDTTVTFTDTGSTVSGTNDGTNWQTLTIDGTTKNIPSGGGSSYTFTNGLTESSGTVSWNLNDRIMNYNNVLLLRNLPSTNRGVSISQTNAYAWGDNSVAIGDTGYVSISSSNAVAIRGKATAPNTVSIGDGIITGKNAGSSSVGQYQVAIGNYNAIDTNGEYCLILGNGTADNARSNAIAIDTSGKIKTSGDIYVGCNADSTGGVKLAKTPECPTTTDGTYVLKCVVSNGVATYSWVAEA